MENVAAATVSDLKQLDDLLLCVLVINGWLSRQKNCSGLQPSGDRTPSVLRCPLLTISDECRSLLLSVHLVTKVSLNYVTLPVGGDLWACSRGPFLRAESWK